MMKRLAFVLSSTLIAGIASAQPAPTDAPAEPVPEPAAPPAPPPAAPPVAVGLPTVYAQPAAPELPDPSVAIVLSPLHLIIPMIEVSAEVRLAPKLGLGINGGVGFTRLKLTDERVTLIGGGISPRYYVIGSFRTGVQIGAEAQYLHASLDPDAKASAVGLSIGPYVGYKWTGASGITLEAQLGVAYLAISANDDDEMVMETDRRVYPLLNLNAGWSF